MSYHTIYDDGNVKIVLNRTNKFIWVGVSRKIKYLRTSEAFKRTEFPEIWKYVRNFGSVSQAVVESIEAYLAQEDIEGTNDKEFDWVKGIPMSLISDAATAQEMFGDDELERFADEQRKANTEDVSNTDGDSTVKG